MKFIVALAIMTVSLPTLGENLVLTVVTPTKTVHVGDHPSFVVTISNRGSNSITLVQPGDGSDCKWRTPVVGWSILPADAKERSHPGEPPPIKGARCGNINSLKLSEVFSLKPGKSSRFESWIG